MFCLLKIKRFIPLETQTLRYYVNKRVQSLSLLINIRRGKTRFLTGFTLLELMIAAAIMVVAMIGLVGSYVLCFNINETAKNLTLATAAIQQEIEIIRDCPFSTITNAPTDNPSGFQGAIFNVTGLSAGSAIGSVRIDDSDSNLLKVTVSVSWRQRGGRIIGADNGNGGGIALNGIRDGTEQSDIDGTLKSPAKIVTLMANR